jgi:outer membrane receptor protein involved in Fe transport
LNAKLPNGQFVIPTPQADGHYSGSAVSTYREDRFNTNIDYRIDERNWLTVKFFFSNAPQFLVLPNGGANVPGFGADREQNNRVISFQDIHMLGPSIINEARVGYSFIRQDSSGQNTLKDSDVGIKRANGDVYPGLGLIRIGTGGVTIGNAGTNVDTQIQNSTITLVDVLSITRGQHNIRTGSEILNYRVNATTNNSRRGQIVFQNSGLNTAFGNFLIGAVNNSTFGEGINTRILRATDYSFFLQDGWRLSPKLILNLGLRYELDLPPYETRGARRFRSSPGELPSRLGHSAQRATSALANRWRHRQSTLRQRSTRCCSDGRSTWHFPALCRSRNPSGPLRWRCHLSF